MPADDANPDKSKANKLNAQKPGQPKPPVEPDVYDLEDIDDEPQSSAPAFNPALAEHDLGPTTTPSTDASGEPSTALEEPAPKKRRAERIPPSLDMPIATDTLGRIAEHLACTSCQTDLYHKSVRGKCPECGLKVIKSIQRDRLNLADATWLEQVASGTGIVVLSLPLLMVALLSQLGAGTGIISVLQVIFAAALAYGVKGMTLDEPAARTSYQPKGPRKLALTMALGAFGLAAMAVLASFALGFSPERTVVNVGMLLQHLATNVAAAVAYFALLRNAVRLAERLGDPMLARNLGIAAVALPVTLLGAAAVLFARVLLDLPGGAVWIALIVTLAGVAIFCFWTATQLLDARTQIARARTESRVMHKQAKRSEGGL